MPLIQLKHQSKQHQFEFKSIQMKITFTSFPFEQINNALFSACKSKNVIYSWQTTNMVSKFKMTKCNWKVLACGGLTQGQRWLAKQIPTLLALSAWACEARTEVSHEAVWGDAGTKFPHRWYGCDVSLFQLYLSSRKLLIPLFYPSVPSWNVTTNFHVAITRGWYSFALLGQGTVIFPKLH